MLAKEYCICRLATGDMLRAAVASGTPVGEKAKRAIDNGQLVNDDLVIGVLKENLDLPRCRRGFVLDGFPRTVYQAEQLDKILAERNQKIDGAIEVKVDRIETIAERISGRLIHRKSGRTYHPRFKPSMVAGKDDMTGEHLIHRNDDNPDTFRKRYETYKRITEPVLEHYREQNKLAVVEGDQPVKSVFSEICRYIDGLGSFPKPKSSS